MSSWFIASSRPPPGDASVGAAPSRTPVRMSLAVPSSRLSARARAESEVVVDYAAPGCVLAHVRNMTISAWNTPPTVAHVEAFMAIAQTLATTYTQCSNLTLVMRDTELPGPDARVSLERLTAEYASRIHSVALVIDGAGFWASMIRSFLTGLHLLRGGGYRCKAFATPAEANPWLLPSHNADTQATLNEREMHAASEVVFARMHAEGPPRTARRAQ